MAAVLAYHGLELVLFQIECMHNVCKLIIKHADELDALTKGMHTHMFMLMA